VANIELSLDISTSRNQKIMRVFDTSFYPHNADVDNYLLEVLPVNKSKWITFPVSKKFSLTLNSSSLQYKKVSFDDDLIDLPDGIYEFKQSYSPNIHTICHFYHLRTTELDNKITSEMCKLLSERCGLTRSEYLQNRDKLRDIDEYLKAAKWMVEECLDKEKGKELYDLTKKLLEEYTNECQC